MRRSLRHALLLGLFATLPAAARPLDAPTRFASPRREAISTASELLERGEFERASKALDQALLQPDLTDDELVDIYRLLGLCRLYLGDEEGAREAFEKLLQARPEFELPRTAPAKVLAIYGRIKEDIKKRRLKPITLTLEFPARATRAAPVTVHAHIENLILGSKARLFFRRAGEEAWASIDFRRSGGAPAEFEAVLPESVASATPRGEIELYAEVSDAAARRLAGKGDPLHPIVLSTQGEGDRSGLEELPWYKNGWVWLGIAGGVAAAAGAATAIALAASSHPQGTLPIRIRVVGGP